MDNPILQIIEKRYGASNYYILMKLVSMVIDIEITDIKLMGFFFLMKFSSET